MRAFEAAARNSSFVAAADELNVTPGAISQHVKALEGWTGMPLFRRNAQGVELTQAGQSLLPAFSTAFDALSDAAHALRSLKPNADFHIAALPSVAQLWLPKRLSKIRARYPDIHFSVTAMETPPVLAREMFDLSIFFGTPDGSRHKFSICPDKITPVCAPVLIDRMQKPDLFTGIPLLHDQTWANDWRAWSRSAGVNVGDPASGPKFSLYSLAVEEAKAGAGALIGHVCLLENALADGSLVQMHSKTLDTGQCLMAELAPTSRQHPEAKTVVAMMAA